MGKALQIAEGAALIGGAIVGAVVDPAMAQLWYSLAAMGASIELGALAQLLEGSTGNFSVKEAAAACQVIYGMTRVSGTIVWVSTTGSNADYLHLIIVWACHPCESLENFYIDGRQVFLDGEPADHSGVLVGPNAKLNQQGRPTAGNALDQSFKDINGNNYNWGGSVCIYNTYGDGTDATPNPFEPFLTPNDPNYPDASYFKGLTASYIKLTYDANRFNGGIPNIRASVIGKPVYDPRSGQTTSSDNMALCIADVITDTNYGLGAIYQQEIDEAALISSANACDEQVNLAAGGTESRYTCNGNFQTSSSVGEVLNSMLVSCAGRLTYTSGLFGIYPGVWRGTSGLVITPQNVLGSPSYTAVRKYRDLVNICFGTFICPTYPFAVGYSFDFQDDEQTVFDGCFQPTNFPYWTNDSLHGYTGDDYITTDQGRTLSTDLRLQFVLSVATAQRIAKIAVMRNRYQASATFQCDLTLWQATALDVVEVVFPYLGLEGTEFEVTSFKFDVAGDPEQPEESPTLTTELELQATGSSIYDWSTTEELGILITPSPTINDAFQVQAPTGLSLTSGAGIAYVNEIGITTGRILATWTSPADTFIINSGSIEVQFQAVGDTTWHSSGYLQGATETFLCSPCLGGTPYNVQVRGVRADGVSSTWDQVLNYTCSTTTQTLDAADVTGTLNAATLPLATAHVVGAVMPDGTSVMVNPDGVLSAVANKVQALVDFGFDSGLEGDLATTVVTGQAWVTSTSVITCSPAGIATPDHDPDDAWAERIQGSVRALVPGVGFTVVATAANENGTTWGKYLIDCVGA